MKKKFFIGLLVTFVLSLAVSAYAFGFVTCPRCGLDATPTGRVQTDAWGIHHEYRCPYNHYFYVDM